jgi:putative ABC transport system permease protein
MTRPSTQAIRLFSLAWRESRTTRRRLLLSMSSIVLGVAALVAIDSFSANVTASVRDQSRSILGGDLAFTSRGPLPAGAAAIIDSLTHRGARTARVTRFASMALAPRPNATRLVQVRATSTNYPLVGRVLTDPADAWPRLQSGPHAIVDPSLLAALHATVGDTISLGYAKFDVIGTIRAMPGDAGIAVAIGPRVFIPDRFLDATQLLTFGSRAEDKALATVPGQENPTTLATRLRPRLDSMHVRLQTSAQTDNNLTGSIGRLRDFLGIIGIVALLLGGIGVASAIAALVRRKVDTVAVLRCLGATGPQVLTIYVAQTAAMGCLGAAAGVLLGIAIQFGLPALVRNLLPVDVIPFLAPRAILTGLATGVWIALLFALRPLLTLRTISPLAALRQSAAEHPITAPASARLVDLALAATVLALALSRSPSRRIGLGIALAIGAVLGALWVSAALLSALARRLTRLRWPYVVRQGVANLYRPANQTRPVVLALGFGAFLISTVALVQSNVLSQLAASADASHGNLIFFDIQQDQSAGLDSIIRQTGRPIVEQAPLVTMRIAEIGGVPVTSLEHGHRGSGWALRREYRSTYRDTLVGSERLVAGHWTGQAGAGTNDTATVSLDADLAKELGVRLGDVITWDVQGVRIPTRVTSLRDIDWARFEPNFFAVFPRGVLEHAPQQLVILASVPNAVTVGELQRTIVERYPNVSSIDLTLVQQTIAGVLHKVTLAIRFMALFAIALGIPVLFSAVAATRRDRIREGVLLKTLGASRAQILRIMTAEYAALGLLASLTGVTLSFAGAWGLVHFVFDASFHPIVGPAVALAAITAALTIAIGLLSSRDVFARTPAAGLLDA